MQGLVGRRRSVLGVWWLVVAACALPAGDGEAIDEVISPNPCTAVKLTAPAQSFTGAVGVPLVLTGTATCPAGQTPEYQYWIKLFGAPNWTILGAYVPGSSTWTPPFESDWCVSVVTRAMGAPEPYQARSASRCNITRCGNHVVDPGEQCDDGNTANGDACDINCTTPRCGNGALDPGEECDDGNTGNGDACDDNCTRPRCGNGAVDPGEACDDGNAIDGDACDTNCTVPACGNRIVDPGEQCDDGNAGNGDECDINCTAPACGNGIVDPGEQCDDGNGIDGDGCSTTCRIDGLTYVKASNTNAGDNYGGQLALSADGSTLAVGVIGEASAATGVNGNQADNSAGEAGAVYVYARAGATWVQQAYVKASNTGAEDWFGWSVALSADGSTLAVGAPFEDSAATGINGNQADNSLSGAGAVYVFTRGGTAWSQQAYVKTSATGAGDQLGRAVALSGNGSTLAVGAPRQGAFPNVVGEVVVFTRAGTTWSQQATIPATSGAVGDGFGRALAISADGATLAIGTPFDGSAATGINGNPVNNGAPASGAVYVFSRGGATWSLQAYIKASNTETMDWFGATIGLSADGSTLAVGALFEDSAATGVDGDQASNSATDAGAAYVFGRSGTTWSQQAYLKQSNTNPNDQFGTGVAVSPDGGTVAVGAAWEDSRATGIGGDQNDRSAFRAGAVYVFGRTGATWSQHAYVKASNTDPDDEFGTCVALGPGGSPMAIGAPRESSGATGINGNQGNTASFAGAVYVFP